MKIMIMIMMITMMRIIMIMIIMGTKWAEIYVLCLAVRRVVIGCLWTLVGVPVLP